MKCLGYPLIVYALVGDSADSPEPIVKPSPATGHSAYKLEEENPYLCYYVEKFPYDRGLGR